jgi:predicted MFS family arabinose efflux permease
MPSLHSRLSRHLGLGEIAGALRQRNYRIYISGNAVSLIGTWMQRIAVGWLTWDMTQSGFWLGLISCADLLPAIIVGPIGGALADRVNRLHMMMAAQSAALLVAVALCVLTATEVMTIEMLALLVMLHGIANGFNQPARLSLIPSLMPREHLSTGIAINSIVFNLARFVGPALAGFLIVTGGTAAAFGANALSFVAFIVALARVRLNDTQEQARGGPRRSLWSQIGEGIGYAAHHPGIGPMLLLLAIASLCVRPFIELMPGFAAAVFGGGAHTLALLSSSVGVGAVIAGIWFAGHRMASGRTEMVLISTFVQALAIAMFAASGQIWIAVPSVAVAGAAMVATGVNLQVLLQISVDGAVRGRVLSLYGLLFVAGPAAGALIMGALSESLGLRLPLIGGVALLLIAWVWIWRGRQSIATALESSGVPSAPTTV